MQDMRSQACRVTNKFEGLFAQHLTSLCAALAIHSQKQPRDWSTIKKLIDEELEWLDKQSGNELDGLRYRTFILILRDLLNVSWEIRYSNDGIDIVAPPTGKLKGLTQEEQTLLKAGVRYELSAACQEQLNEKATQDFIRSVEEPAPTSKNRKSIKVLIADGQELTKRLSDVTKLHPEEQVIHLRQLIRPYLVLVEADERDQFTGIKYGDIWRYFRLTWSIPNVSSPGRKLLYLVRDAAHPYHAIMAIAGLSNSALQVRDRDDYIGWTTERVTRSLKKGIRRKNFESLEATLALLESYVERGLQDVDLTGIVSMEEIDHPDEILIRRLQASVEGFSRERQRQLQLSLSTTLNNDNIDYFSQSPSLGTDEITQGVLLTEDTNINESVDSGISVTKANIQAKPSLSDEVLEWDEKANRKDLEARRQLILKKRAQILYQLLYARREFQRVREAGQQNLDKIIEKALLRDDFRVALTYAIFSNKREKVGINMLEITTCGAVQPYNHLLGGKLVALLLLSPQIGADYSKRYSNKYSWISSQIKGEKIYRDCDLVFLSTTSLYSVGSSQYNRLFLPAATFHPQQPRLEYKSHPNQKDILDGCPIRPDKKDWQTSGFGTVHFSSETTETVVTLGVKESGFREVNSVFGEGPSPKLRKIRSGLVAVGLDPEVLLRHNQPRLLYCIDLCDNSRSFLNGEDVFFPDYITNPEITNNATEEIADYWRRRWLMSRLHTANILDKVAKFTPADFTLKLDVPLEAKTGGFAPMTSDATGDNGGKLSEADVNTSVSNMPLLNVEFIQKLYLNQSSYSDFLDTNMLDALHIPTLLDVFIKERIAEGYSVILTGNAGDGKTHLIKRLKSSLANAEVIEDASEFEPSEIVEKWQTANRAGIPFCMAANEWPLFQLISKYADQLPVLQTVNHQLKNSLVYTNGLAASDSGNTSDRLTSASNTSEKIIVINLGLRNPLSREFFEQAMNTLLNADIFVSCANCAGSNTCDAVRNRDLLMEHSRIRNALITLIDRVAIFGQHITVRDLLGFLSFAVFGGRTNATLSKEYGKNDGFYSQQIFSGKAKGELFNLLRQYLDPARISHPKWDNRLYFGYSKANDSTDWELGEVPIPPSLAKEPRYFEFLKRRFFFEHACGLEMLNMLSDDEIKFAMLLDPDNADLDDARDQLVDAINAYFCVDLTSTQQNPARDLIVWSAHSYDERVVRAFTSWFSIDRRRDIRLQRPRLASYLKDAFTYRPDHLRLVVFPDHDPVTLTLDFDLYHTLMEVKRGLPSVLVDEGKSVRLLRFMSSLEAKRPSNEMRPRIRSYTVQGRDLLQFEVDITRKKLVVVN